jgi:hypothetical protein
VRVLIPLLAIPLLLAPNALAQGNEREEDEITVTSQRQRGSVPGDAQPETTFSAGDVRSYGASNIFQILAAVAPHTGSASIRGGGMPIVLLNGRRTTGFQEIRDLPPDVISRVEVFDEQLSLQYGFSPDQRVVNIVLERRFETDFAEAGGSRADTDARASFRGEAGSVDIEEGNRFAVGASFDRASAVTEDERDIAPPLSGPDVRRSRTLSPATENWRANATFARALSERVTGNASLRVEQGQSQSLLGLDSAGEVRLREGETQTVRAAAGLDGAQAGWLWTATATADFVQQESSTADALFPARTNSDTQLFDLTGNVNGLVFDLPGGSLRATLRLGGEQRSIESFSSDASGVRESELDRTTPSGRAGILAPLTSRREQFGAFLGDITFNASAAFSSPSDFRTLTSQGYGVSWSPLRSLRFSLQAEQGETAPSLQQLGDPLLTTPSVSFFDPTNGQTVFITRTTGGNPGLDAEEREDLIFNAGWSPSQVQGLSFSFSWARNLSRNAIVALPAALPETETAFPGRYARDPGGTLIAVDTRAINLAERDVESIRWGVSFSRSIGAGPDRRESNARPMDREEREESTAAAEALPPVETSPPRRAMGDGARAGAGRWNISVFHRVRLLDEAVLVAGLAPIDLLDRGGLDGGGEPASSIEFEGGVFYRGLGLRLNGAWQDGYAIPVATGGELAFSDRWTVNARAFVNFDQRADWVAAAPFLRGARLALGIENLTDSFVEVRDQTGAVPSAYQEGYLNPLGRVVQLSFRKQF